MEKISQYRGYKKIVFKWKDRGDPLVCYEYKTDSEQETVAEILEKWFGVSIS